jgi:diphthine synthase
MLYLISLGLHDEKDISVRGLEAAGKCDELYAEFYTTGMRTNLSKLSGLIGKKVTGLERVDLEERCGNILKKAKERDIAVLVGGDALAATTHISLLLEAKKMGVKCRVIHGSSIFSAVGETGLQLYKFGRTVTLPYIEERYRSSEFYGIIFQNKKMGLHTLILLDIQPEKGKYMDIADGLKILLEIEKQKGKGIVSLDKKVVAACCLGGSQIIRYDRIRNLTRDRRLKSKTPAVLIIPGELHFMEKEFLECLE